MIRTRNMLVFAVIAVGGIFINPAVFIVFGGIFAITYFKYLLTPTLAALVVEIYSGIPAGIMSIPLSMAGVAVEAGRLRTYERYPASRIFIIILALLAFVATHMVMLILL